MKLPHELLTELNAYWQTKNAELIAKLTTLIQDFQQNPQAHYLYFEHDFEDLAIFYYYENQARLLLGDYTDFFDGLFPNTFFEQEVKIDEEANDNEAIAEAWDDYEYQKLTQFQDWFADCWHQSRQSQTFDKRAFFSVHDSFFIYDLEHREIVKGDSLQPNE